MKDMKELLHSAHLTKTQRIIAEYVLDNASEACFMTSTEIALKLGVSESSVIRFSRSDLTALWIFRRHCGKNIRTKYSAFPAVSQSHPSGLQSRQNQTTLLITSTGILRMLLITLKRYLSKTPLRPLRRLRILLFPVSTNTLLQREEISVLQISSSCI